MGEVLKRRVGEEAEAGRRDAGFDGRAVCVGGEVKLVSAM